MQVEDIELVGVRGTSIHAWWATPPHWQAAQGALLYCHGNAGNLSHRGESVRRWLAAFGVAVLIFDYPGYGKSQGVPTEEGCYAAAGAGYDWVTTVAQVEPEKLLLYGGSLGGAVAIDVASRRPNRALVLVSAFLSLADMARKQFPWLPTAWLVAGARSMGQSEQDPPVP
jgi:pimeloyl-ACP methyl ester carboxylesterase